MASKRKAAVLKTTNKDKGNKDAATFRSRKRQAITKEHVLTVKAPENIVWERRLGGRNDHIHFMNSKPKSQNQYIQELNAAQQSGTLFGEAKKTFYEFLGEHRLQDYVNVKQKSQQWLSLRYGRFTGSIASSLVGHNSHDNPLPACNKVIKKIPRPELELEGTNNHEFNDDGEHEKYESKRFKAFKVEAMEWGAAKEAYASQCYCTYQYEQCTKAYRRQRLEWVKNGFQIQDWKTFQYREVKFPVLDFKQDPVVEIRNWSFLRDTKVHRGISPDGILVINGIVLCCIEIKCPFAQKHAIHACFEASYYDQLQCEIYLLKQYWPSIQCIDYINWSPTQWTLDTFVFDQDYFMNWYLPREARMYFSVFLPKIVAFFLVKFKQKHFAAQQVDEILQFETPETMAKVQNQFRNFLFLSIFGPDAKQQEKNGEKEAEEENPFDKEFGSVREKTKEAEDDNIDSTDVANPQQLANAPVALESDKKIEATETESEYFVPPLPFTLFAPEGNN